MWIFFFIRTFLQYFEPFLKEPKNIPNVIGAPSIVKFIPIEFLKKVRADLNLKKTTSEILQANLLFSAGREIKSLPAQQSVYLILDIFNRSGLLLPPKKFGSSIFSSFAPLLNN